MRGHINATETASKGRCIVITSEVKERRVKHRCKKVVFKELTCKVVLSTNLTFHREASQKLVKFCTHLISTLFKFEPLFNFVQIIGTGKIESNFAKEEE